MKALMAAALLIGATQAGAVTVEVASGDWNDIPLLKAGGEALSDAVVHKLHTLVESGTCVIPGQTKKRLDMSVPFLVHYPNNGGEPDRIIISKIGCAEAESVIGGALSVLVKQGAYQSSGVNKTGWYRSEVSFSYS